uniref:Uncharacterized protein n=1 Tax=virus sp. ctoYX9 TaxID=2825822 RepID=A0A8S5RPG5_9VIRU|nr:MAG TPA: hypothetical protein [virus sp. ctoYX9]
MHGSEKRVNFVVKIRERNFPDERKPRRSSSQT